MSRYRKRAGSSSKRKFSRSASRVHRKNIAGSVMRGGIRL